MRHEPDHRSLLEETLIRPATGQIGGLYRFEFVRAARANLAVASNWGALLPTGLSHHGGDEGVEIAAGE